MKYYTRVCTGLFGYFIFALQITLQPLPYIGKIIVQNACHSFQNTLLQMNSQVNVKYDWRKKF